jgi:hypothetical protein
LNRRILLGLKRLMIPVPRPIWQGRVVKGEKGADSSLGFMSIDHHRVRNFVVSELPRVGKPLSPEYIARELDLPNKPLKTILDELEEHMTFLFRDQAGAVTWAYPVTVDVTPHRVAISSGEQVYAA